MCEKPRISRVTGKARNIAFASRPVEQKSRKRSKCSKTEERDPLDNPVFHPLSRLQKLKNTYILFYVSRASPFPAQEKTPQKPLFVELLLFFLHFSTLPCARGGSIIYSKIHAVLYILSPAPSPKTTKRRKNRNRQPAPRAKTLKNREYRDPP